VLELGCGTGDMWKGQGKLISRCSRLILSDFSEGMLEQAKETLQDEAGIEYRVIDIQDIPYPDHSFDAVIANMMLYHVPDLARGLREVSRVLKKDGTFFCATFGEHGMMEYIGSLFSDRPVETGINRRFHPDKTETEKLTFLFRRRPAGFIRRLPRRHQCGGYGRLHLFPLRHVRPAKPPAGDGSFRPGGAYDRRCPQDPQGIRHVHCPFSHRMNKGAAYDSPEKSLHGRS
jgi:Methylase involved in ubiquinone/menaquinone biosynthesis